MDDSRDVDGLRARLEGAGLRATGKRLALGRLVFRGAHWHFSAEELWRESHEAGAGVSLATVYNTLNSFVEAGLLRTVALPGERQLFDTNTADHAHLFFEDSGAPVDLPEEAVVVTLAPGVVPAGTRLARVDVMVRVCSAEPVSDPLGRRRAGG